MKYTIKLATTAVSFVALCAVCSCSSVEASTDEEPTGSESSALAAVGCTPVSSPFPVSSLQSIVQNGAPVPGVFSRPTFPNLIRQGPWSAAQFVKDSNGLTLPAIVSTGVTPGWMSIPFESGEILTGFTVWACGNGQTAMFFDSFSTITADEPGDSIDATGSGGMVNVPNVWTAINLTISPILMHTNSMVYLTLTSTSVPTPSMAVAAVIPHFE